MGIRFACHHCERRLNIKDDLAGKVGACPHCRGRIRIPLADSEKSESCDSDLGSASTLLEQLGRAAAAASPTPVSPTTTPAATTPAATTPAAATDATSAGTTPGGTTPSGTTSGGTRSTNTTSGGNPAAGGAAAAGEVQWYVRPPSGGQYGPASGAMLRQWVAESRITSAAMLWREGWSQWRPAESVFPQLRPTSSSESAEQPESDLEGFGQITSPASVLHRKASRRNQRSRLVVGLVGTSLIVLMLLAYMLLA